GLLRRQRLLVLEIVLELGVQVGEEVAVALDDLGEDVAPARAEQLAHPRDRDQVDHHRVTHDATPPCRRAPSCYPRPAPRQPAPHPKPSPDRQSWVWRKYRGASGARLGAAPLSPFANGGRRPPAATVP